MLTKRIIACLDVRDGRVVKGQQFRNHEDVGDIIELASFYSAEGVDELVFYDITASSDGRTVDRSWISQIAKKINIPFCVAGGIRTAEDAKIILNNGADKISINSPALENPDFISDLAHQFGTQCVVVGIDSREEYGEYLVYQYTGDETKTIQSKHKTLDWVREVEGRGAGEIVLNCMNQDGMREGYDTKQLKAVRDVTSLPLIASGGAGSMQHFKDVFVQSNVDGALAASVFHKKEIFIPDLKQYLKSEGIYVRV
ncbi:MAG: imidazole glycerol phosphate synthase subunit HisF [Pseudomonadota bacterium]